MIPISFSSLPLPLHVRQPKRRKIGLLKGLEIGSECQMNATAGKNGFLAAGYTASGFLLLLSFCRCRCRCSSNALSAVLLDNQQQKLSGCSRTPCLNPNPQVGRLPGRRSSTRNLLAESTSTKCRSRLSQWIKCWRSEHAAMWVVFARRSQGWQHRQVEITSTRISKLDSLGMFESVPQR